MITSSFLIYVLCIFVALFIWKKYGGKMYFWLAVIGLSALIISVWNYIAKNFLDLSPTMHSANFYFVSTLRAIVVLAVLFVIFRDKFIRRKE